MFFGGSDQTEVYQSVADNLAVKSKGFAVVNSETGTTMFVVNQKGFSLWDKNGNDVAWKNEGSDTFNFKDDVHIGGNLIVNGNYPKTLSEEIDYKGIDLLHELYKKDLQIEELQERVSKLESTMDKMVKLIERGV